jgi:hypothetical protein
MYRQGDVYLFPVDKIPANAIEDTTEGDVILAYGEATGHHHRLTGSGTRLFASAKDRRFLCVKAPDTLVHEEHAAIVVDPGNYEILTKREYLAADPSYLSAPRSRPVYD